MRYRLGPSLVAVLFLLFTCPAIAASPKYLLMDLGVSGGRSLAESINNAGQIAGYAEIAGEYHAVLWESDTMTDLGTLGGPAYAMAINELGQIVGYSWTVSNTNHAFLWDGSMMDLGALDAPAWDYSNAYGINDQSEIVGLAGIDAAGHTHAAIWSGETVTDLGTLGATHSNAYGINNSGDIVGYSWINESGVSHAVIWQSGGVEDLGTLGGSRSLARDINDVGEVVGYAYTNDEAMRACLWQENGPSWTATDLGTLGGDQANAEGINVHGAVVGTSKTATGANHAFLFEGTAMTDLNELVSSDEGWTLESAFDVNDAGWIVGKGLNSNGQERAFLLIPIPEPVSVSLLGAGGVLLLGRRRRDWG
ncbi:hypothetical protein LCGC14_0276720 [marine sediment metagenome]|uniref:PEP-CTERM protein-sorting domain-containing protein n=1 Tax=marine sediment metagenome TaxID=412755 RepID=A0A0F9X2J6_9ZZZZ|nr:DUF3466 family protein [Phycisphaerae bacterium]HDZ43997.1 DUF3466 family protein [Phycisphaerae bacterium]